MLVKKKKKKKKKKNKMKDNTQINDAKDDHCNIGTFVTHNDAMR